ncbi:MAG: hypothetical protein WCH52_11100, partial [Bacteroidota bacterium]
MFKKIYFIATLSILFSCNSISAQQVSLNWVKHLGASGEGFTGVSMVIDSNKAVIVAGLFKG